MSPVGISKARDFPRQLSKINADFAANGRAVFEIG
jgi:hypothetical protein